MPQTKPPTPWTADTGIAFLLALRLTKGVRRAAAEIRREPSICYRVRERDAEFAAAWDAIVAEQVAARRLAARRRKAGVPSIVAGVEPAAGDTDTAADEGVPRGRWDGLLPVRRRAFLRALAETGEVAAACQRAGISDTAVYRVRAADAEFAANWDRALASSPPLLEQVAWERAVEGWEEPVFHNGVQVGTRRRHSELLMRQLIVRNDKVAAVNDDPAALRRRAVEAARAAGGSFDTPATREETNAAIMKKLKGIEGRLGSPAVEGRAVCGRCGRPVEPPGEDKGG